MHNVMYLGSALEMFLTLHFPVSDCCLLWVICLALLDVFPVVCVVVIVFFLDCFGVGF